LVRLDESLDRQFQLKPADRPFDGFALRIPHLRGLRHKGAVS
jgi:hypothetical protein